MLNSYQIFLSQTWEKKQYLKMIAMIDFGGQIGG